MILLGDNVKRLFTIIISICLIIGVIYKLDYIENKIASYFSNIHTIVKYEKNTYSKNESYDFVSISDDFVPYNYQELLNIFYTVLDAGYDTFTFYCPVEYTDCLNDVIDISNESNNEVLTTLGNYVAPFNNFNRIKVGYDTAGEITITIEHKYTEEDIENINKKIDEIWSSIITEDMDKKDIIYAFHDYIINNTKYDELYESELKSGKTTHQASKANGVLFEGYAICSGYTDTMAIILDRLNLKNYEVASSSHVWNTVYIDDTWLHIDLTWDDPVSQDSTKDNLLHKFYLIDTETLLSFDIEDHTFNKSYYLEIK